MSTNPDLEGFADEILGMVSEGCTIDADDVYSCAKRNRLLKEVTATESCGDHCECVQYSDFPTICYRKTDW